MSTNTSKAHRLDSGLMTNLFGDDDVFSLCAMCAPIIQDIAVEVIKQFGAAPEAVIAVLLDVAAAALGGRFRLRMADAQTIAPAFNVIIGHNQFRELVWFDMLQAPFVSRVAGMQIDLYKEGARGIEKQIKQRCEDLDAASKTHGPNPALLAQAKLDIARLQAGLQPFVVLNRFSIKGVAEQLAHAFDPAILSVAGGSDPMDDLSALKPAERRELVRVLNLSWEGRPVQLTRSMIPGVINILWNTPRTNLERLKSWREFYAGTMPAPALLLLSNEPPANGVPVPHRLDWQAQVNRLFDLRCINKEPRLYTLMAEAEAFLVQWSNEFTEKLHSLSAEIAKHLVWLPGVALRLALLMEVMGNAEGETISEAAAQAAVSVTRALGRAHLQTLLEIIVPRKIGLADNADETDKAADMLSKILSKGPISRRDLRRCYDNQRTGWFDEVLEGLMSLGKVRSGEDGLLVACDSGSDEPGSDVEQGCEAEGERSGNEPR